MAALKDQQSWQEPFCECQHLTPGNVAFSSHHLPDRLSKHDGLSPVSLGAQEGSPGLPDQVSLANH